MRKPEILLVGYGRFGRLAAALLRPRWGVHVLERRRRIVPGTGIRRVSASRLGEFRVVLLSLPADELRDFLVRNGDRFSPGTFVADLCAVKVAPMRWMRDHLPGTVQYAGLHPLFGPDSLPSLKSPGVVVCRGRTTPACLRRIGAELRALGLNPLESTPATHDRAMASTLFLTQTIGHAARRSIGSPLPFSTPGFDHLSILVERARADSGRVLRDLYRWNPYCPARHRALLRALRRKAKYFE